MAQSYDIIIIRSGAGAVRWPVLPVIAAYTSGVYWVFRGKVRKGYA